MTMSLWVTEQQVRDFQNFEASTGRYSDQNIGSNIRAAQRFLQRTCTRQWEPETATKLFTTNGAEQISIPDLRSVTAVLLNTVSLTVSEGYWLIPSRMQQDIYIGIQLRPFRRVDQNRWYLAVPDWFDRGLDLPNHAFDTGLPNDLSIAGAWGHSPIPEDVLHGVKALAAFFTLRPDALLANARTDPQGNFAELSSLPLEVTNVIAEWSAGTQLVAVG